MREERPNYYSILPATVRYDKELTDKAKLLYSEITSLCNANGECWANNNYFAELYNTSTNNISKNVYFELPCFSKFQVHTYRHTDTHTHILPLVFNFNFCKGK